MPERQTKAVAGRFAANLRRAREEADLTQEDLAFRAAVHRTQISLLEGGRRLPRFETLVRLAGGLGVSTATLTEGIVWEPVESLTGGLLVSPAEDSGDD